MGASLPARLATAQDEGLAPNMQRLLKFLGHTDGDAIELIELEVPVEHRGHRTLFARTIIAEHAVKLLCDAESMEGHGPGLYLLMNKPHPATLHRSEADTWTIADKGQTCTDNDIVARRALYVDVDVSRPSGTSATDQEVQLALSVARRIHARFADILQRDDALGLGHSGNGAAVFLALANLEETSELKALVKGILVAVGQLYGGGGIKIDCAVADAKRLVPAFGTIKRKGAPNVPERPHRRTAFVCADVVHRLDMGELERVLRALMSCLAAEQQAEVEKAMGKKAAPRASSSSSGTRPTQAITTTRGDTVFSRANDLDVWEVLARLGLIDGAHPRCPGCGVSGDSSVAVVGNGLKCLHATCAGKARYGFRTNVDLVVETMNVEPLEAARTLLDWFGVEPPRRDAREGSANCANSASHPPPLESQPWCPPTPLRSRPVLPVFPVDTLPEWLHAWVTAEAIATQTPVDMAAAMALACLSLAAGKKYKVSVNPGWNEPVNLYLVAALEPGNRKSAVVSDALKPVYERERLLADQARTEGTKVRAKLALLDKTEKKAVADAITSGKSDEIEQILSEREKLKVPVIPRLLGDDATPEKLAAMMAEQGGQLGILSAEGDVFDIMSGRYSGDGAPNLGIFLKAHAGDDFRVDRIHRETVHISAPCLTLGLTIQPAVLTSLINTPSFRERGLLARILYALPESHVGFRHVDPPPVPADVADGYRRNMLNLLQLPERRSARGEIEPALLTLSPEAASLRVEFAAAVEPRLGVHGDLYPFRDWGGKLVGAMLRIAGLLHLAEHGGSGPPIAASTVEKAIGIASYYIEHAREAFAIMGADARIDDAIFVVGCVARKGWTSFTKRELFEGVKGRIKKATALDDVLNLLADHGHIRRLPDPPHPGPGRKPSTCYEVNPYLPAHNSHNPQNSARPSPHVDAHGTPPSHYSQNSQNAPSLDVDAGASQAVTQSAGMLDSPEIPSAAGASPKRQLTPEELNALIDERSMKRQLKDARQAEEQAATAAALRLDRERIEAEMRETRMQMSVCAAVLNDNPEPPQQSAHDTKEAPMKETEVKPITIAADHAPMAGSLARAAELAAGAHTLSDAVAIANALGGSLTDALARCRSALPPAPMAPSPPASSFDSKAWEVFQKAADAAEKVHGTGKYARTGTLPC